METVKIIPLKNLSRSLQNRIREAQLEAGKVYTKAKNIHFEARKSSCKWPTKVELQKETKSQFALHSQSVQMITHVLLENVETTKKLRKTHPKMKMKYPWRDKKYFPIYWPKQALVKEENRLILPMGRGRASLSLRINDVPDNFGAAKIVWNDGYELHLCIKQEVEKKCGTEKATVDLGQIHQAAVVCTTGKSIVVSGRGIRSIKRLLNKSFVKINKKRSKCKKGSKRWKKLQQARRKISTRVERRARDLGHKGTRKVINFCKAEKVETIFVGNPDGVQRKQSGKKQNQRMSQWEFGRDIKYLKYKAEKAGMECFTGSERGTSSQCPQCSFKKKPSGRRWKCPKCFFVGHRDLVGATNMHPIAFGNKVLFPRQTTYLQAGSVRISCRINNFKKSNMQACSSRAVAPLTSKRCVLSKVGNHRKQRDNTVARKCQSKIVSVTLEAHPL